MEKSTGENRLANVFVIGPDEENLETIHDVPGFYGYRFYELLSLAEAHDRSVPISEIIHKAEQRLDTFEGPIDAIVGYWDFPVSTILPILRDRHGLPGPTLESVLKCEHKYWSRLEQEKVITEHPGYALINLEHEPKPPANLKYPIWLKPVKSFSSALAYRVASDEEFHQAVGAMREKISELGEPFQHILDLADLPPEIKDIGGSAVLAEEAMSGQQAAVEGYCIDGHVEVYGTLDSLNYPHSPCFLRHQYPSQLPETTVRHMEQVSRRVISHIGLECTTFSIEFFCDPDSSDVRLLEINPRHSQSHAELFELVDGIPNHHCMLRLALGRAPVMPFREGDHQIAALWCYRRFNGDAVLVQGPSSAEIASIEKDIPGVTVRPLVCEGQRLSELPDQDSYSHELANLIIGGENVQDLESKYQEAISRLTFKFDEVDHTEVKRLYANDEG